MDPVERVSGGRRERVAPGLQLPGPRGDEFECCARRWIHSYHSLRSDESKGKLWTSPSVWCVWVFH